MRAVISLCFLIKTFCVYVWPYFTHKNYVHSQSLSLAATSKIPKRKSFVSRNLKDKKVVSLTMELQVAPPQDVTSSRVHEGLDEVLITYSAQSDDLPPEKFRSLVDILRDAPQAALEGAMETLLMCRGAGQCPLEQFAGQLDPKVVQVGKLYYKLCCLTPSQP